MLMFIKFLRSLVVWMRWFTYGVFTASIFNGSEQIHHEIELSVNIYLVMLFINSVLAVSGMLMANFFKSRKELSSARLLLKQSQSWPILALIVVDMLIYSIILLSNGLVQQAEIFAILTIGTSAIRHACDFSESKN